MKERVAECYPHLDANRAQGGGVMPLKPRIANPRVPAIVCSGDGRVFEFPTDREGSSSTCSRLRLVEVHRRLASGEP